MPDPLPLPHLRLSKENDQEYASQAQNLLINTTHYTYQLVVFLLINISQFIIHSCMHGNVQQKTLWANAWNPLLINWGVWTTWFKRILFRVKTKSNAASLWTNSYSSSTVHSVAWLRKKCNYENAMLHINASKQDGQQSIKMFK